MRTLFPLILLATFAATAGPAAASERVIFETDMVGDPDDAGALALLHALADRGECEILAVMHNTSDPYTVGCLDAMNTFAGRPDIPTGAYPGDDQRHRARGHRGISRTTRHRFG